MNRNQKRIIAFFLILLFILIAASKIESRICTVCGVQDYNVSIGGIACGVSEDGLLQKNGYTKKGPGKGKGILLKTPTDIVLEGFQIPNYSAVNKMVKDMHVMVPLFKIISWDVHG